MVPPDNWEIETAAAAKKAAAIIAQAKEKAFPSTPKAKPGPKGFDYVHTTGKVPSSCPVLKAILDRNGDGPLPTPPEIKPPPVRYTPAERNVLEACVWCKKHEGILLPVDKFKHKIGTREDWYFWDPVEAHTRAMRDEKAETKMTKAGWRLNHASQGFKNYRASIFNASVSLYKEESLIWARGHHIAEADEFAKIDSEQYVMYLKATHKPCRFSPHSRFVADSWIQSEFTRENLLWKIHRERINAEGCAYYADATDQEDPMIAEQAEDDEELAQDFPANVEVYQMKDDGEERESTYRTPR
eukprot:692764-Amphidinium_carterae.1